MQKHSYSYPDSQKLLELTHKQLCSIIHDELCRYIPTGGGTDVHLRHQLQELLQLEQAQLAVR